jgi:mannose-6-phosphate isomerase
MTLTRLVPRMVEKPWGRTDLPAQFGAAAAPVGEIWFEHPGAPLPLLVKWLFTSDRLSVQVHPNDAQAAAAGLPGGKEECWVVVAADPGACLGIGTTRELGPDALRAAAMSGEIATLLDWKPVSAGDWFHIAPGTVHAIGAGITLIEVQQAADVTYRLFDYGRPRALHIEAAVAVSRAMPYQDPRHGRLDIADQPALLSRCSSFSLYHGGGGRFEGLPAADLWLVPVAGSIELPDGSKGPGAVLHGRMTPGLPVSSDFAYLAVVAHDEGQVGH